MHINLVYPIMATRFYEEDMHSRGFEVFVRSFWPLRVVHFSGASGNCCFFFLLWVLIQWMALSLAPKVHNCTTKLGVTRAPSNL